MGEILGGLVQASAHLSQASQGPPHPESQPTTQLTVLAVRNNGEGKHCECLPFLFLSCYQDALLLVEIKQEPVP